MEVVFRETAESEKRSEEYLVPSHPGRKQRHIRTTFTSARQLLNIFESQPTLDEFTQCLKWLQENSVPGELDIHAQTPYLSQVLGFLTTTAIANFWPILRSDEKYRNVRKTFVECLQSVFGLGALVRATNSLARHHNLAHDDRLTFTKETADLSPLLDTGEVLDRVLTGSQALSKILGKLFEAEPEKAKRRLTWKLLAPLLCGSKVLVAFSQINEIVRRRGTKSLETPLSRPEDYSAWLGCNLQNALSEAQDHTEDWILAITDLFRQGLSVGHRTVFVENFFKEPLNGSKTTQESVQCFFRNLKANEKKKTLFTILEIASTPNFSENRIDFVAGFAALLKTWCDKDNEFFQFLEEWVKKPNTEAAFGTLEVHRAVVAVVASTPERMLSMCEEMLLNFGGKLEIQQQPILRQESTTRDLLLIIGRLWGTNPDAVRQLAKSSSYINAISNRIAASSARSQYLGMVLATAVSEIVDEQHSRVGFAHLLNDKDDLKTFTDLMKVHDKIGSVAQLQRPADDLNAAMLKGGDNSVTTSSSTKRYELAGQKGLVQAIDNSSESSDSDDDPIFTKKTDSPPVYIRELLEGLRDTEHHDRFMRSLSAAANLIRRKASFGTEVSEHSEDLGTLLVGIKDAINDPQFSSAQLNAMIALIVAQPEKMGKWFSLSAFTGDYSVAQRLAVLSAIALAARELAGYKENEQSPGTDSPAVLSSKRLPPGLLAFATTERHLTMPVDKITFNINKEMIQPMAATAADKVAGPDALKVRTISSRIKRERTGPRLIRNQLSKHIADSFVFPLIDRFRLEMETRGSTSSYLTPLLLAHYLKTLALLLHAAGPSTMSLPALTSELLTVSLAPRVRGAALEHLPVLDATLFCILTILEINSNTERDLVVNHGNQILEIKSWVETLLNHLDRGDGERERIRILTAGVLVRCSEIIERYQQDIVARMIDLG